MAKKNSDKELLRKLQSKALEKVATKMIKSSESFDAFVKKYKEDPNSGQNIINALKKL